MGKLGVIIPIYKVNPSKDELKSLESCLRNLSHQKLIIITHDELDLSIYYKLFDSYGLKAIVEYFSKFYFNSLSDYNRLLRGFKFYNRFSDFEFILIFQLDAYVFSGNLDHWLSKGDSYVGAPWFRQIENEIEFIGVGNGGISLRKVDDFMRVFHWKYFLIRFWMVFKYNFKYVDVRKNSWKFFSSSCKEFSFSKLAGIFTLLDKNEDIFWSKVIPRKFTWFKVAGLNDALCFSFEAFPQHCFGLNNHQLPFGCHGWQKYDPQFWSQFIELDADLKFKEENV
ncbi:hypothetical protein DFQ04_1404 [Algoriphagus boseongensis]|uniref:DUF5672 domain-containing protein n=1 Tax=Algoriphagus boseongensis TaxID=1442587 RepID=A0A4R6T9V2_9BACT|nr:DUF5672 family protein [Algoriphagus boseongensis]TDQ19581.1 hypothetical protein DFQ04_1404 [Algoriphagus boseongensis]